ncbi:sigma-54 interaction domain-containing protein [Acinetobacter rudis]|uniref:Sigma-54 dependent transcriptional regulator n=1 Tax=Acinetobacter rudis TaxID=632955 RepID=A0AAW8J870_9GAMM|nr:sigma-54 dependent transcriptional regulator [Acinetobacter rudis]MDQ8936237.1 sigma-54 dependent transcriptional regulator [Acinetobacter rudis]MDQ8953951.1 sigma-54 dependent transcriptional regulator [Acinetobacter rudis]MDQ9018500.1 sigma-54 dependent transcriptional regulator [Acinetobacter rudis]
MPHNIITLPEITQRSHSHKATAQVFNDPESQKLFEYIQQIAPSDASVLIHGETGTGKELIARQIHEHSARRHQPFIAVNCGAFSEALVESELFGHEKGAFTGALSSSVGWFEAAHGGTLLLDEIGDLSKRIQVKLLRVLQEREIVRLGSRKKIDVDVRILAATNVSLEQAILSDQFREDLYYRLNVVSLNIKPLRERQGDIIPLAQHFIEKYHIQLGYDKAHLSPNAKKKLIEYWWPGNIRELENMIHHALLICQNNMIEADDLSLLAPPRPTPLAEEHSKTETLIDPKLKAVFHEFFQHHQGEVYSTIEQQLLRTAYHYCHKNQVKTAQLLGLSRNILRAKLIEIGELVISKHHD